MKIQKLSFGKYSLFLHDVDGYENVNIDELEEILEEIKEIIKMHEVEESLEIARKQSIKEMRCPYCNKKIIVGTGVN